MKHSFSWNKPLEVFRVFSRGFRKNRTLLVSMSAIVVFIATYMLILPAMTLDEEEATEQGGIDVPGTEQSADTGGPAFEGDGYTISLEAGKEARLPEDTELSAAEVTPEDKDYDAWCDEAVKALQESSAVKEDVSGLKTAKFYDITLMADGSAFEPADAVNVNISYDKALKMKDMDDVKVIHFCVDKKGNLKPEVLRDSAVDVKAKQGKKGTIEVSDVAFEATGFSMYGVVEMETLEKTVITADGKKYKITVTYDNRAEIPAGSELDVKEIDAGSAEYSDYLTQTENTLGWEKGSAGYARLFDITIVDGNGKKVSIADSVDVKIELSDAVSDELNVVHFGEEPEVVASRTENGVVEFEANGFSVYAVVDGSTDANARMKLEFYSKGTKIATIYVKNGDTAEELEYILYDPGAGSLDSGELFSGWILDKEEGAYTTQDVAEAMTIDQVRAWAEGEPITEGEPHRLDAAICKLYHITYKDTDGTVLGMDAVPVKASEYGTDAVEATVKMAYTPKDDVHNFEGWTLDAASDSNVTSTIPADRVYQNDKKITIKGDISFTVNAPEGAWLIFDENGKGGKYNAPHFIKSGETTQAPCSDEEMIRNGYSFGGWYTEVIGEADAHGYRQVVESSRFTFGSDLTEKTTLYAKWIPNERAPYTVIFWTQNEDRTGYDLKASYINNNGRVGSNIPYSIFNNGDEDYAIVGGQNYQYTGFCAKEPEQQVEITPEGDAVLNIYYDRIKYNLRFYLYRRNGTGNNDYQFAQNSAAGNNIWGIVNWHNATSLANMPTTTYPGGIHSQTRLDGNNITGYYIVLSAYYGEDISDKWPTYEMIGNGRSGNTSYAPVSYVMMVGTKLKPNPSSGGDGTLKGVYNRMDENILGATNNADGNFLIVRFNTYNNWTYHCYFEAYDGQELEGKTTRPLNGKTYYLDDDFSSRSSNTLPGSQNPPQYAGFAAVMQSASRPYYDQVYIDGVLNGSPQANSVSGHNAELNYYYNRLSYPINYMDGTYFDGNGNIKQSRPDNLLHTSRMIDYQASIPDAEKNYVPDLPAGESGYVFAGWYADAGCKTPYNFSTMPIGGIKVYAKWVQEEYRVFLHPNAGRDQTLDWGSDNVSTSFRVPYGGKVSTPTGTRENSGYEFVGWYTDPSLSGKYLFNSDTELNNETVRTPYDQTEPTERDKWGDPTATTNSDALNSRFWITKKLDLYAKWRKILEGAEGINVIYTADDGKGHSGTNVPVDDSEYPDQAEATAQAADTAPAGMHFKHWVIQTWNESEGKYEDINLTVLPGQKFTVSEEYAKKEPKADHPGGYTYTMQLRAEYSEPESELPTHIWWFENYPDTGAARHNSFRQDEGIQINEAVNIQAAPTRNGYTFLGWARIPTGRSESAVGTPEGNPPTGKILELTENDLYLKYENGLFKLNDATSEYNGSTVTKVAADERLQYHDMYAVWKPKTYTVTIKKVVEGAQGDERIPFDFIQSGIPGGATSFKLVGSDHVVIQGQTYTNTEEYKLVPYQTKFSVKETSAEGFVTTVEYSCENAEDSEKNISKPISNDGQELTVDGDITITFTNTRKTVPIKVVKIDQQGDPLTGAGFTFDGKDFAGNNNTRWKSTMDQGYAVITENSSVPFGTYTLNETNPPAGFYPLEGPVTIEVTTNSSNQIDVIAKLNGAKSTAAKVDWVNPANRELGCIVSIRNTAGVELPSTGGAGPLWFYLIGAVLLLGCGSILMVRRRMQKI